MQLLILSMVLLSATVQAKTYEHSFLPKNEMNIEINSKAAGGISSQQFESAIQLVERTYARKAQQMGGELKINRNWADGTVNAGATRIGRQWIIEMFGGLARYRSMTQDGFLLVLCHEVGHHMGGAPKKVDRFLMRSWASNDGQSDYFASLKCLKEIFAAEETQDMTGQPASLVSSCEAAHPNKADAKICVRIGMAGMAVATLFSELEQSPAASFTTPDRTVVSRTLETHPKAQCRLDTYLQAALCEVDYREEVSQTDEVKGTCHSSLGHSVGLRPSCWFKAR